MKEAELPSRLSHLRNRKNDQALKNPTESGVRFSDRSKINFRLKQTSLVKDVQTCNQCPLNEQQNNAEHP
ncbi:MAG: hypothetical protein QNL52_03475, partial [Synechococcus sp. ChBW.bin.23]